MTWAIILATLMGPVLAVQAQKWIEHWNESKRRKLWVFSQLMSTRQARLSPEHVQALNFIDITFYGSGPKTRRKKDQDVLDKWHEYHHHLSNRPDAMPIARWVERGDDSYTALLEAMAVATGFKFDRVQLKSGGYSPVAFANREDQQEKLIESTISVLSGETPLHMNVIGFPIDEEAAKAHKAVLVKLGDNLTDDGLRVATKS